MRRSVQVRTFTEVGGCCFVETFVTEGNDLVVYSLWHRQPVERSQERGNVLNFFLSED